MKKALFLAGCLLLGLLPVAGAIPQSERDALIALYTATQGTGWYDNANWLGAAGTENTWYGVTCNVDNTHVTALNLNGNNLTGTLPAELGDLTGLTYLNLFGNHLDGSIPAGLGRLTALIQMRLDGNDLSGSIPSDLGTLGQLTTLELERNALSGTIPASLGGLSSLTILRLYTNNLEGSIPAELGSLIHLHSLDLHDNHLSGPVPAELGGATALTSLNLRSNALTGELPWALIGLSGLNTDGLDLRWNGLYTTEPSLRDFLNSKQYGGDFEATQTISPADPTWTWGAGTGGQISWTPIPFTGCTGGYEIWGATTTGGPYHYVDITADKSISSYTIECLGPGTIYYFVIRAVTYDTENFNNRNTVSSDFGPEIAANPGGVKGDLTGDGFVSSADVVILANYLAGNLGSVSTCTGAGDLTGDFTIKAVDLTELMTIIFHP